MASDGLGMAWMGSENSSATSPRHLRDISATSPGLSDSIPSCFFFIS